MILLAAEGHSNDEIATALSVGRDVVSLWRKRFFYERLPGLEERPARAAPGFFPPELVVQVKAWRVNCRRPSACRCRAEHRRYRPRGAAAGMVATVSDKTVWRWLHEDAIRPWQHRTWIFPARSRLRRQSGAHPRSVRPALGRQAAEATMSSCSAPTRKPAFRPASASIPPRRPAPRQPMRVEHEYVRGGAWAYLAALDVHRAKVFGRCEPTTGIAPFDRLVAQVMTRPPYHDARRVFWIVDNGSSHRGPALRPPPARRPFPIWSPCTPRSTPVGSTRSKSTSRSSSARCSPPMISPALQEVEDRLLAFQDLLREHRDALRMAIHQG